MGRKKALRRAAAIRRKNAKPDDCDPMLPSHGDYNIQKKSPRPALDWTECEDTPEVTVTYNMPMTPPRSPDSESESVEQTAADLTGDAEEKSVILNKKLTEAAKERNFTLVKELHAKGANLLSMDANNMTVLHYAAKFGSFSMAKYLVENAPLEILDTTDKEHGETALLKAARYRQRQICSLLVTVGASASKTDKKGNTPSQQASNANDEELATYLEVVFTKERRDDESREELDRLIYARELFQRVTEQNNEVTMLETYDAETIV